MRDRKRIKNSLFLIEKIKMEYPATRSLYETIEFIYWVARSHYRISFHSGSDISERVIYPVARNESNGIEDARFVQFIDESGEVIYYATYTAFNGRNIIPMLLETKDFLNFKMCTLYGNAVKDKGMALFPRKINGKYFMISRQDGENLYLMSSDNVYRWDKMELLKEPQETWELLQIGNCGSTIETNKGWLLLTHGVGALRKYCIGALLLDIDNPNKIIGKLDDPLIMPFESEREGYVPNVVYSCGAIVHNGPWLFPMPCQTHPQGSLQLI